VIIVFYGYATVRRLESDSICRAGRAVLVSVVIVAALGAARDGGLRGHRSVAASTPETASVALFVYGPGPLALVFAAMGRYDGGSATDTTHEWRHVKGGHGLAAPP